MRNVYLSAPDCNYTTPQPLYHADPLHYFVRLGIIYGKLEILFLNVKFWGILLSDICFYKKETNKKTQERAPFKTKFTWFQICEQWQERKAGRFYLFVWYYMRYERQKKDLFRTLFSYNTVSNVSMVRAIMIEQSKQWCEERNHHDSSFAKLQMMLVPCYHHCSSTTF